MTDDRIKSPAASPARPAGIMPLSAGGPGSAVIVLEKSTAISCRHSRGEHIHPSTLEIMHELGLARDFSRAPPSELRDCGGIVGEQRDQARRFCALPTRCRLYRADAAMGFPQLSGRTGSRFPGFHLGMESEVTDLVGGAGRHRRVRVRTPDGTFEISRRSGSRRGWAAFAVREPRRASGSTILARRSTSCGLRSRKARRPGQKRRPIITAGLLVDARPRRLLAMRLCDPQGRVRRIRDAGIELFRDEIVRIAPFLRGSTSQSCASGMM